MFDFVGNVSEPSRRSNDRVVFENENEDEMSELDSTMASVTENYWEEKNDSKVPVAFTLSPSSDQYLNPSFDVSFCKSYPFERRPL